MKATLVACALSLFCTLVGGASTFSNPLRTRNGSDPFLVYVDGYYYLMTTTWRDLQIIRAKTLEGLKTGESKTIYTMANPKPDGNDVWAPELHKINGTWHVYYSQDRFSWVLTGGPTPWGEYTNNQRVHEEWGIDGTVAEIPGWGHYYVFSCERDELQSLCIATMNNATSVGPISLLSQPLEPWERVEIPVNEGPAPLHHGNKTWIAYSASFCKTPDYQIASLLWDGESDPLEQSSWKKSDGPLFSSANGNYGTAHNFFFTSPDGTEIWNIYHATQNSSGSCGSDRQTFAQKVNWSADGSPDLGIPVKAGEILQAPSGE
ncbi:glycosyl hydrolase [Immersiella caudata]|uniref:Glycosyl hydrolase n=1 Tax=Immersiella caudata TaxID=314043 RepID=A0AA40BUW5_9PEZI|nr:glycosyl hydrolase [Immersiella caudata]